MTSSTKRTLLEAACRVIADQGIERLRTHSVAEAAGCSKALLHYHYGSRRELVLAAFAYSDDRAVQFVGDRVASAESGLDAVRTILLAWASDDGEMRRHWIVWAEMWRWSTFDKELRALVVQRHTAFVRSLAEAITRGKLDGSVGVRVDVPQAAQRLAACSDSFGDQAVIGIMPPDEMRAALAAAMAQELTR
ncbi:TetR/AcrR family transcriptional regulator [Streptomyces sp. NPDC093223]|uniref:TetR/AcrR family transcriptional regulator n=1 Tax=Streptomyces sp. NPDC093223 TaxID=3366033 RepID=UPI00381CBF03